MSVATANSAASECFEFRCNKCWQSNVVDVAYSNQTINCHTCAESIQAPEANADRIARAREYQSKGNPTGTILSSIQNAELHLKELEAAEAGLKHSFSIDTQLDLSRALLASPTARLLAMLLDSFVYAVAWGVGMFCFFMLVNRGVFASPSALSPDSNVVDLVMTFWPAMVLPTLLAGIQWIMIAKTGQSIGKLFTGVRIVTQNGRSPGFIQGVILRNWVRAGLQTIPFFGLVDSLFILTESRRCLHDYFSGTSVIEW